MMKDIFRHRFFEGNMTCSGMPCSIMLHFSNAADRCSIKITIKEIGLISIPIYFFTETDDYIEFYVWDSPMLGKCIFKECDGKFYLFFLHVMPVKEEIIFLKEVYENIISQELQCGKIKSYQSYQNVLLKKQYIHEKDLTLNYEYQFDKEENRKLTELFDKKRISCVNCDFDRALHVMRILHKMMISKGEAVFIPEKRSGLTLLMARKTDGILLNCRGCAIVLNDTLLGLGIPSKFIACMSDDPYDPECHVVNSVFIKEYHKWIMLDVATQSYVQGDDGIPMSIYEVHSKLIKGEPLKFMIAPNISNVSLTKQGFENYLIKNMFCFLSYEKYGPYCDNWNNKNQKYLLLPNEYSSLYNKLNLSITNTTIITDALTFFEEGDSLCQKK